MRRYVIPKDKESNAPIKVENVLSSVVYQANPLVERKNNFSTLETKLFYLGLTQIRPKLPHSKYYDEDFLRAVIPTREVIDILGGDNGYYNELKKAVESLVSKSVYIKNNNNENFVAFPVFAMLQWEKDKGLTIEFNKYMLPFLLDLANRSYTRIEFEQIWKLSSIYAIRILELCLQYRNVGERTITIEELRKFLGIDPEAYKGRMDNLKKIVVELPVKEINEKTNFNITYDYKKTGRSVTAVHFRLIDKNKISNDEIENEKKNARAVVSDLVSDGVDKAMANTLLKKYGSIYCAENVKYVKKKYGKTAKNLAGYLVRGIQEDYYGQHKKKLDKEVMEIWPTLDDEDIKALRQMEKKGDEMACRRLELYEKELDKKYSSPTDDDYYFPYFNE